MTVQTKMMVEDKQGFDDLLVDPKTYANEDLYHRIFASLRQDEPIYWAEPTGFRPFWVVSRHADVCRIELKAAEFLNEPRLRMASIADEERFMAFTGGQDRLTHNLGSMDGAEHRLFRSMTQSWFSPKEIRKLEDAIRVLARQTVDDMLKLGERCDFVQDVALRYPLRVIMTILGVPDEDEAYLMRFTRELFGSSDPETRRGVGASALIEVVEEFSRYCDAITEDRRKNPRDDVATVIANARVGDRPITQREAMSYYLLICTAGHDTTSSSSAMAVLQLIKNPDQMELLRSRPELLPNTVDEAIRWASPIKHFFRTAVSDTVLHDKTVRAGDHLMMCYPSANRDEAVFEDPFAFRVDRAPAKHIAFGYGPHVCLGQHLAKLEIRILLDELLARVDNFALDGETPLLESTFASGLKSLPITYSAR